MYRVELRQLEMTCVFLVCFSSLLKGLAELTGHVHRNVGKQNPQCRSLRDQNPLDRSLGGHNPQHWFSGEWNPQLQTNLMAAVSITPTGAGCMLDVCIFGSQEMH